MKTKKRYITPTSETVDLKSFGIATQFNADGSDDVTNALSTGYDSSTSEGWPKALWEEDDATAW